MNSIKLSEQLELSLVNLFQGNVSKINLSLKFLCEHILYT